MESGAGDDITLLLQLVKQGSEPAFNALYKLHSRMLLGNIRNLVKDNEIAKELLQDLYLKIWENRLSIDTEKHFKSFLFTIAKNIVYDYFRKLSLDKRAKTVLFTNALESYTHTEEELNFKERNNLLKAAIDRLPGQCRQVYILSKLDGKSHEEISRALKISVSTVNNHMVKANKTVRLFILQHGEFMAYMLTTIIFKQFVEH